MDLELCESVRWQSPRPCVPASTLHRQPATISVPQERNGRLFLRMLEAAADCETADLSRRGGLCAKSEASLGKWASERQRRPKSIRAT